MNELPWLLPTLCYTAAWYWLDQAVLEETHWINRICCFALAGGLFIATIATIAAVAELTDREN